MDEQVVVITFGMTSQSTVARKKKETKYLTKEKNWKLNRTPVRKTEIHIGCKSDKILTWSFNK